MHFVLGPATMHWLIAAGLFYALSSVFVKGRDVYMMLNSENDPLRQSDVGLEALNWAIMGSYIISTLSMVGALITSIIESNSARNYSKL
jgi:hypothetical protein